MIPLTGDSIGRRHASVRTAVVVSLLALTAGVSGCGRQAPTPSSPPPPAADATTAKAGAHPLAGTRWQLVELQSMDDAIGTAKPSDRGLYTMDLGADGTVAMRLNCNRATGTWAVEQAADAASGQFRFGPLAGTRALCPPPSLDERILQQAEFVRSYLLRDGRLYLSLMADGGILAWEPATSANDRPGGPEE